MTSEGKHTAGLRIGRRQRALLTWAAKNDPGAVYIGATTVPPRGSALEGLYVEEVLRSCDRLVDRHLLRNPKPGFYYLTETGRAAIAKAEGKS